MNLGVVQWIFFNNIVTNRYVVPHAAMINCCRFSGLWLKSLLFAEECNIDMNKIILSLMIISGGMVTQAQSKVSIPYCPKVIEPEPSLEVKYFVWDQVPENGKYGNTGCGASSLGIQNAIDFWIKVKCFRGLFGCFFWNGLMASLQNLGPILINKLFQTSLDWTKSFF